MPKFWKTLEWIRARRFASAQPAAERPKCWSLSRRVREASADHYNHRVSSFIFEARCLFLVLVSPLKESECLFKDDLLQKRSTSVKNMLSMLPQKSGFLSSPERKRRIMSRNSKELSSFQTTPDNSVTRIRPEAARPRKRRKTNIMEGFRSISLSNGCLNNNNNMYGRNCHNTEATPSINQLHVSGHTAQGQSQANSNLPYSQTRSRQDNIECMLCDDDNHDTKNSSRNNGIVIETLDDESSDDDDDDVDLLSDKELVERKVMYELALGKSSHNNKTINNHPPKHPVDAKVEEWIRRDMWQRWLQKQNGENDVQANKTACNIATEDDIDIDDECFGVIEQHDNNGGEPLTPPPYMFTKSDSSLSNMETEMEGDNVMSVDMIP